MIAITFLLLSFIYLATNVIRQLVRNRQAFKFFEEKSSHLPVLEAPNIISGHWFRTVYNDYNYKQIDDLHKTYGKSFGFYTRNQPWLATKDLDLIKLIMIDQGHKHSDRASFGVPIEEINNSIFQINGDRWRRVRRSVGSAMTNIRVKGDAIAPDIEMMVAKLRNSLTNKVKRHQEAAPDAGKSLEVDADHLAKCYSLAVLMLVFYKQDNVIDFEGERDAWIDEMAEAEKVIFNPILATVMLFPFLQTIVIPMLRFHVSGRQHKKMDDFIMDATGVSKEKSKLQREKLVMNQSDVKDKISDALIRAYLNKKMSHEELYGTMQFFFAAGFETSAGNLTNLIWSLARHPDKQEKLRKSLVEEKLDSSYLLWCILESIRRHPPVPLGIGRVLAADIHYKGMVIPQGTFVAPSIFSIHHDPDIWPEPDKFEPERWSNQANFHPAAFMGFGLGPRNCVGGKLAVHEIKMVLQMLVTNYRIEKCSKTPDDYDFISPAMLFTMPTKPIIVKFVPLVAS